MEKRERKKEVMTLGIKNGKVHIEPKKKKSNPGKVVNNKMVIAQRTTPITEEELQLFTRRALFYTNIAYMLADMANTMSIESESELAKIHKGIQREEKMRFANALEYAKRTRTATKQACAAMYEIPDVNDACNDSDYLTDVLMEVIDRTGNTEESQIQMLEYIKEQPSRMHIDEWLRYK